MSVSLCWTPVSHSPAPSLPVGLKVQAVSSPSSASTHLKQPPRTPLPSAQQNIRASVLAAGQQLRPVVRNPVLCSLAHRGRQENE